MENLLNEDFQCDSKETALMDRYFDDPQADRKIAHALLAHKERSGCNKFLDTPINHLDKFSFNSCLCNFKNPLIHYFITITDNYERGVLPHNGSLSEQSARLIDVILLISSIRQEHLAKMRERLEKQR